MIVYQKTKGEFLDDILTNDIENIIGALVKEKLGRKTGQSEMNAWRNSMIYMNTVLMDHAIPDDAGISIEYQLPNAGLRIDFVITGRDEENKENVIIIELKQWAESSSTSKDGIVSTFLNHAEREVVHPSYQAWSYAAFLENFNEVVYTSNIELHPCAYLHNHSDNGSLTNSIYIDYIKKAPLFFKSDAIKLRDFIKKYVVKGDQGKIMYRIEGGRIRPSKQLADSLASMIRGKDEFVMLDEQKLAFETAKMLASKASKNQKHVLIVRGGPGTGKTVVAINLLVKLTKMGLVAKYVTRNAAPREVYKSKLTGTIKRSIFDSLFVGSGAFTSTESGLFHALIIDEAHRLNEKSGMFQHLGENQIKEIISASHFSVFFLDENQRISVADIGSEEEIEHWGKRAGAEIHKLDLYSQFRCNGSDGYLAWLDNVLDIRETANQSLQGIDYDFQVVESPEELRRIIIEKNKERNRARIVAGYCWDWVSKKNPQAYDIMLGDKFSMRWNLTDDGMLWIMKDDSINEVGCIHTCQGLELDYIGVIIGPDLIFKDGLLVTNAMARARIDTTVKGRNKLLKTAEGRDQLDIIIKNTYRTLMTRGMKGCYVYCTDKEMANYLRNRI